jgi:hypothetical protein
MKLNGNSNYWVGVTAITFPNTDVKFY